MATVYATLERLAFGRSLMRARTAHLPLVGDRQRLLIVGEGDGRLLQRIQQRQTTGEVVVVERSGAMIDRARHRLQREAGIRVHFHQADVRRIPLDPCSFDGIVTPFVLNTFDRRQLEQLVPRLATSLRPGGVWLHVDFALPAGGGRRLRARLWLALLYTLFGHATDLTARKLVEAGPLLEVAGLRCVARSGFQGGMVVSRLYVKAPS